MEVLAYIILAVFTLLALILLISALFIDYDKHF